MKIVDIFTRLWQQEGTRFNTLFSVFVVCIHIFLMNSATGVIQHNTVSYIWGVFIVMLLVIETLAIYWKHQELRIDYHGVEPNGFIYLLWFLHLCIGPALVIFAGASFGLDFDNSILLQSVMPIFVIRELWILAMILLLHSLPEKTNIQLLRKRGQLANHLLLLFAVSTYFIFWEVLLDQSIFIGKPILSIVVYTIAVLILFIIFFLGTRMMIFVQESYAIAAGKKEYGLIWTIFIAACASIIPLYFF